MAENSGAKRQLQSIFAAWKKQHEDLLASLDQMLDQLRASAHSNSVTSEDERKAVEELYRTKDRLGEHFNVEMQINKLLEDYKGRSTPELDSWTQKVESDHRQLLSRMEQQIDRVVAAYQERSSLCLRQSIYELGLFLDALEQHEDQEADSIGWLMPNR